MPALGTTVERDRRKRHGRFDYYLRLADALFNRPDESGHLKQLAHSFGRDILNLATLAGRLFLNYADNLTSVAASELRQPRCLREFSVDSSCLSSPDAVNCWNGFASRA